VEKGNRRDSSAHPAAGHGDGDVATLQRSAGNLAVATVLAQRQTPPAPTPQSVGAALDMVTLVSSRTTKVTSLRPWIIFRTLPRNPSDGGKKRLYTALKKAHAALQRAEALLAAARQREAGAGSPSPSSAKPARKGKKKGKRQPTVAEAQAVVDAAVAAVRARTQELKEYVKGKLDTTRNPMIAPLRAEKTRAAEDLRTREAALRTQSRKKKPSPGVIAQLTEQRDAARAKVETATAAVNAKLAALRAEIDGED
jgi:hypothetical protein